MSGVLESTFAILRGVVTYAGILTAASLLLSAGKIIVLFGGNSNYVLAAMERISLPGLNLPADPSSVPRRSEVSLTEPAPRFGEFRSPIWGARVFLGARPYRATWLDAC